MAPKQPDLFLFYRDSILKSYGQIFFTDHAGFSFLIVAVTFVNPYAGISGMLAAASSVFMARGLGLNPSVTRSGLYSYNSVMLGLVMGIYYQFNLGFFIVLLLGNFTTLLLTVWLAVRTTARRIPFLSLPFIFSVWIVLLSARSFETIKLSERGVYAINELWSLGGPWLVNFYEKLNSVQLPWAFDTYLKSLSSIIFQFNWFSGLILAIGLLVYSRIAFTLSLIGFYSGYLFCYFVQGNIFELQENYIGFNFILSAIAIGGFFIVPSARSYVLVALSTPLVSLLIVSLGAVLRIYQLPLYSLPFSLFVIGILFLLNNRYEIKGLALVVHQQFSPEKNLYEFWNKMERFRNDTYHLVHLPFFGEWRVSQGHNGSITHKDDWRFAWDFDITDETGKTFRPSGRAPADFFCYGLPVLAPAAGYVVTVEDQVEDNEIGEVNIGQNWGNSVVIKHSEYLFSTITHIKPHSFKVKEGDYVKKGDILASCGNTGRSPEPHLHFQLQAAAFVGAQTISYPICYFISRLADKFKFHSFEIPAEGQMIMRPEPSTLLKQSFRFTPGMKIKFRVMSGTNEQVVNWEVFVDAYNQAYLYCHDSRSMAYFVNDETLHYFTSFQGDHRSLLYRFYLGAYKVLLSYYPALIIEDNFPVEGFYKGVTKALQDFVAPFHRYLRVRFESTFTGADDASNPSKLVLQSTAVALINKQVERKIDFLIEMENGSIAGFKVTEDTICTEAKRLL